MPQFLTPSTVFEFSDRPVSREVMLEVLGEAFVASSAGHDQPWKFVVVTDQGRDEMLAAMRSGFRRELQSPMLPHLGDHLSAARRSLEIAMQAPVTVFLLASEEVPLNLPLTPEQQAGERGDQQSAELAMERMEIRATQLGLGSLWLEELDFARTELRQWLDCPGELVAGMAFGYPAERPSTSKKQRLEQYVQWR